MRPPLTALITCLALLTSLSSAPAQQRLTNHDFEIIERRKNSDGELAYFAKTTRGDECKNNPLNRLTILSENQFNYPTPESGCGPTAMLNILVWYEKFGLIEPFSREVDPRNYKLDLFQEIDRRVTEKAGHARTETRGTSNLVAAMVMDEMIQERSDGQLRIHTEYIEAPLKLSDFIDTMPNFRAGYLIVSPKDPQTGKLLNSHAVTVIRADRAGYITLSTWGKIYRGLLKKRPDGQWFIPQDPKHLELKINALTRFIPFKPTDPAG